MNTTVMLIGSVSLDAIHLVLISLSIILAGVIFWLRPFRSRVIAAGKEILALREENTGLDASNDALERDMAGLKARLEASEAGYVRERADMQKRLEESESGRRTIQLKLEESDKALTETRTREEERARAIEEERKQLRELRQEVESRFKEIAHAALHQSQEMFLKTANETFGRQREATEGNLKELFSPLNKAVKEFDERVQSIEKVRAEDKTAIFEQVRSIGEMLNENRNVTSKLVNALSSPKGGGSWGEESLRNALELAGVSEHCDFLEQNHDAHSGQRPDVILKMPGGREIVIDSKAVMDNYLRASEETDEARRDQFLAAHARHFKDQIKRLASKDYWKDIEERVDFVAMWVPGENFYSAALSMDRDLFDFAAKNRVLIVTPSTLIALAKAVAYGWRQEEASRNALEAAKIGRELHKRLKTLSDHIEKVGRHLGQSVSAYNKMTGSYDRMVMSQARKFETLQLNESGTQLPEINAIEDYPTNARAALLEHDADKNEETYPPEAAE